jgi:hypothetical protein
VQDSAAEYASTYLNLRRLGNYYSKKRVKIKNYQFYSTAILKRVCIALKVSDSKVGATLKEFVYM